MTFTFDPSLANDVSLVRFHIGDNSDEGHYLDDETIQYFVTLSGVGTAVIRCIQYIITQLSQPDFRKDWMSVSSGEARKGYEALLKTKAQEFSISISGAVMTSSVTLPFRPDSYQTVGTQDGAP
jgi:hypothetical protein